MDMNTSKSLKNNKPPHFVGLGGGGSNVVEHIQRKGVKAHFTCITYPKRQSNTSVEYIPFKHPGHDLPTYSLTPGTIADFDRATLLPMLDSLLDIFSNDRHFILLSGLGGYTGSRLTEILTQWLYANGKSFQTICCTPFSCEGKKRNAFAMVSLAKLAIFPNFHHLSLQSFEQQYGDLPLNQAFHRVNEEFYRIYQDLLNWIDMTCLENIELILVQEGFAL